MREQLLTSITNLLKIRSLIHADLEVNEASTFSNDLGFDDEDKASFLMEIEDLFEIYIKIESANSIETIGNLITYLENEATLQ